MNNFRTVKRKNCYNFVTDRFDKTRFILQRKKLLLFKSIFSLSKQYKWVDTCKQYWMDTYLNKDEDEVIKIEGK